jgi:hypothetical protein
MEFNMSASTKQVSIAIAVTLGIALSMRCRFRPFPTLLRRALQCRAGSLLLYGVAILFGCVQEGR